MRRSKGGNWSLVCLNDKPCLREQNSETGHLLTGFFYFMKGCDLSKHVF
jgi:hypothetical protein